jgi:NAD(P)-dependent dehydrogenase (short-subunit alcohol dehydrogenase family)
VKDLAGRVAFVTGGSTGIGLGIVKVLAKEQAPLAAVPAEPINQARADSIRWILSNPIYDRGA